MSKGSWKTFGLAVFAALVGFVPINFAEAQSPSPQSSPEQGRGGRQSSFAVAAEDLLWKKLESRVAEIAEGFDGVMGVAIVDLTDGRTISRNADRVFPTA